MRSRRVASLYERFLRKAPKQSRSRSVVEAVLDAAAELLPKEDDEDVSLHEIAGRAGVGVGSLYDYFADRGSVFSGLAAKITEDNLRRFEQQLETSRQAPLSTAVREIVDLMFDTYLRDAGRARSVLRIAHRVGFMPTIAESQTLFARALAAALRQRTDVDRANVDVAAYVVTNMAMGVIHTSIWSGHLPFAEARLREETSAAILRYLREPAQRSATSEATAPPSGNHQSPPEARL